MSEGVTIEARGTGYQSTRSRKLHALPVESSWQPSSGGGARSYRSLVEALERACLARS